MGCFNIQALSSKGKIEWMVCYQHVYRNWVAIVKLNEQRSSSSTHTAWVEFIRQLLPSVFLRSCLKQQTGSSHCTILTSVCSCCVKHGLRGSIANCLSCGPETKNLFSLIVYIKQGSDSLIWHVAVRNNMVFIWVYWYRMSSKTPTANVERVKTPLIFFFIYWNFSAIAQNNSVLSNDCIISSHKKISILWHLLHYGRWYTVITFQSSRTGLTR